MKRFGEVIKLKPEGADEYVRLHANPRPEVNAIIKDCNIQNYSIFKHGDYLFAYYEYVGDDYEKDMEKMASSEITQDWWNLVKPLMLPLENREEGEFWSKAESIYYLK